MPTDHDTYLHKVASAPVKENVPPREAEQTEARDATGAVSAPITVLPGELVSTEDDESPYEITTDEQDASDERDAFDEPEAEAQPDGELRPEAEVRPEAEPEPELEAKAVPAAETGREPAPETREPVPEAKAEPQPGLLTDGAATRAKWMHLQASFVDDPRAAVTEGAALVTDVLAQLEAAVRNQQLNGDTEALRLQMRRYRLLVDRLTGL
jgi:hypothetical protein